MKPSPELKRILLLALFNARPHPLTDSALRDAARIAVRPRPTEQELTEGIRALELGGFCLGTTDELMETTSWALTTQGELKAAQLA